MLAVGNMYPPHHLGGYELVWRSCMEHLRDAGHAVSVLTSDFRLDHPDASLPERPGTRRELQWYWHDHAFPRRGALARLRIERHNQARFAAAVDEFEPDVVSWWSMGGMSLSLIETARRRGLPAVGVVHDDWPLYGPKVDAWTRALGGRRRLAVVAERVTGVPTCHSLSGAARWLFNSGVQAGRVAGTAGDGDVISPGIDPSLFQAAEEKGWGWRLLYCGRLDERKGVDLAVQALAELPEARLVIVGGGDQAYRAELERLASRLGVSDRVAFERRSRAELRDAYAAADALLFPVRWQEPWGLVPLEAMAVGTPVVASGRGGSAEYLREGENCLLADPDAGPGALAEAVRALAGDPALRSRLREGGFATSAQHTEERFNRQVEAALAEAVGS